MRSFPVDGALARSGVNERAIDSCRLEDETAVPCAQIRSRRTSRIWWWVLAAFAIQLVAWTAWFAIAAQHKIEEIPLVADPGGRHR